MPHFTVGTITALRGDVNNAPDCRTLVEWATLDTLAGTPDTVAFTMADGTMVKVQSLTVKKLPGYIVCSPGSEIVFCDLYFKLLGVTIAQPMTRTETVNGYRPAAWIQPRGLHDMPWPRHRADRCGVPCRKGARVREWKADG